MDAVTLTGVKVNSVSLPKDEESGNFAISGKYDLMANNGKKMATQEFNGYSDFKVEWSAETKKTLEDLLDGIKNDINAFLGFKQ